MPSEGKPQGKGSRPPEPLTAVEVERLLGACSQQAPTGVRNAALVVLLWRCGLRCSEALALYPKDVDADKGTVRVLWGKGQRSRTVGIDPGAVALVQRWIDKRVGLGLNGRHPLLCTLRGASLQSRYVRDLFKRLGHKAGIEKRVHPHGLRHTHACELRSEGVDIGIISKQLGHASMAVTAQYLDHVAPQAVIDAIRARGWGG